MIVKSTNALPFRHAFFDTTIFLLQLMPFKVLSNSSSYRPFLSLHHHLHHLHHHSYGTSSLRVHRVTETGSKVFQLVKEVMPVTRAPEPAVENIGTGKYTVPVVQIIKEQQQQQQQPIASNMTATMTATMTAATPTNSSTSTSRNPVEHVLKTFFDFASNDASASSASNDALALAPAPPRDISLTGFKYRAGQDRRIGLFGLKMGMTTVHDKWGRSQPATIIQVADNQVFETFDNRNNGQVYCSVAAIKKSPNRMLKSARMRFIKYGMFPRRKVAAFKVNRECVLPPGTPIYACHFVPGQRVRIQSKRQVL